MRHPAERVVLFEDKNPFPAELRDRPGRRETAHTRTDHDDVGFLVRDHPHPLARPSSGVRLAEPLDTYGTIWESRRRTALVPVHFPSSARP